MGDYRQLTVWGLAHNLVKGVYRATEMFPPAERWRLTNQLCRAAASVPANIAEGSGRNGGREFARFLGIALGSANEVEYHLLLAKELGYLPTTTAIDLERQVDEIKRMLAVLISRVQRGVRRSPSPSSTDAPLARSARDPNTRADS